MNETSNSTDTAVEWDRIDCPICGGDQFSLMFELKGEQFVRCNDCQLALINPRPVYTQVAETYDEGYSQGYSLKTEKKLKRARRWIQRVKSRYVGSGRWLDIGCSIGIAVRAAKDAGFEAHGIEVEAWGLEYGRTQLGLDNLVQGLIEEHGYADDYFDVISMYEVIEHVPDLNRFVAELKRILRPGGVIDIRTPDIGHWRVPKDLPSWDAIKPSEHLYYFTYQTLSRLLEKHGLTIVKKRLGMKPGLHVYAQHQQE